MTRVPNRLLFLFFHSVICVSAMAVIPTSSASAQTGYPTTSDPRLEYVPPTRTMEELQREYDSIRLVGPAIGVPASYFIAGAGAAMVMSANFDLCFYNPCADGPKTASEKRMTVAGSIVIAAGITGFVVSIVRIVQKREKKRRLRYEMGQLRFGT